MSNGAPAILALNCGSSSLKFDVYEVVAGEFSLACEGEAEEIGRKNSSFWVKQRSGDKKEQQSAFPNHEAALTSALEALGRKHFAAVGHRIVHGGPKVRGHQRLTSQVLDELRAAVPFAPLHLPASLAVLDTISKKLPDVAQVVCLDTAFHRNLPDVSQTLALPEKIRGMGVERYGFHGISIESILAQLEKVPARLVVAHLGNGASITAVLNGQSVDTSMGLTPTGGLLMGTRCGDLDPGVLIYLMRHGYQDADMMEALVDRQSGLAGVSGLTNDVRELSKARTTDANADLALRMFSYQVRKTIAGMAAVLNGIDLLVFTGGIGEHAADLREDVCKQLQFCGKFEMKVLTSQEDLQITRITAQLMGI